MTTRPSKPTGPRRGRRRTDLRRMRPAGLATLSLAAAALLCAPAARAGGPETLGASSLPTTDQLIIKFKDDGSASSAASADPTLQAAERLGYKLRALRSLATGGQVFKLEKAFDSDAVRLLARALMRADKRIDYAEPDQRMQPQRTPNDPDYARQWHYFEPTGGINLPPAWDLSRGAGVVVAVLDTGYRPHADLAANLLPGYDFIASTPTGNDGNGRDADASDPGDWCSPRNSTWHGTHVAGTIAAVTNNARGGAGVAYEARIVPVRVLGTCGGYTSDIADGIVWASGGAVAGVPANANPAKVMNLSLGGGGACSSTYQAAIDGARGRGTSVVVSAGNSNADAGGFQPANCNGVITVAATDRSGQRADYSNYGASVEIAAPGGETSAVATDGVYSTLNAGTTTPGADSYAYYQGTSMAAPHVTGVVALMLSANPALTPDQVASTLRSTARPFPGACAGCGSGVVNALAAVQAVSGTGSACTSKPAVCMLPALYEELLLD